MAMVFFLFILMLGLSWSQAAADTAVRRLVLAAGANNGGVDRDLLRYAVSDAENFVRVLEEMGGLDPADVLLLRDPDLADFEQGLHELSRRVTAANRRGDRLEVLLYYSGHADEEGLLLAGEHLDYSLLRRELGAATADVHIAVLDACASGAITRIKGGQRQQSFLVDESFDMRGYAFLTSSSADEAAQESDAVQASFFTHYLVSGMRGAADVTGDGRVTLNEAYQFAFAETLARTTGTMGGAQHPAYDIKMSGTGDVVMTDVRRHVAGLSFAEALEGRLYVRNGNRHLVAELYKPAGRAVELGLEPGHYTLHLETSRGGLRLAELVLAEGERAGLGTGDFRAIALERTVSRGSEERGITLGLSEDHHIEIETGEGYTLSMGLLTNTQDKAFRGAQFAWLVNQARERAGTQISGIGNLSLKAIKGWQVSGVVNWAMGPIQGSQVGVLNIAPQVRGWQLAGSTNIAGKIRGWQVSSATNFADEVKGGQFGAINVAGKVKGWQFGMINVSGDIEDGLPVGLINYSRSGLFNLSAWRDEIGLNMLTLTSGSRSFYSSFTTGFKEDAGRRTWAMGVGFGLQKSWPWTFLSLDVNQYRISRDLDGDYSVHIDINPPTVDLNWRQPSIDNFLTRIKIETGVVLDPHTSAWLTPFWSEGSLSLFGGVSVNHLWADGNPRLVEPDNGYDREWEDDLFVWPGFFFGLRYGR